MIVSERSSLRTTKKAEAQELAKQAATSLVKAVQAKPGSQLKDLISQGVELQEQKGISRSKSASGVFMVPEAREAVFNTAAPRRSAVGPIPYENKWYVIQVTDITYSRRE